MIRLRDFRSKARGLPDLLPYAGVIGPGLVLNKDGSLLCAFEVRGANGVVSVEGRAAGALAWLRLSAVLGEEAGLPTAPRMAWIIAVPSLSQ